jgi:hypothetical protein
MTRLLLVWCSLASGALLVGGALVVAIGRLGASIITLTGGKLPTVPGLLFAYPLAVPGALAGGATAAVLGTGWLVRPRGLGLAMSVLCGAAGLGCLAVVAVSSLALVESVLGAFPKSPPAGPAVGR